MANLNGAPYELSQAQLQLIRDEIDGDSQYEGKSGAAIARIINTKPLIDNPIQQQQIYGPPLTPAEIMMLSQLTYQEIKNIVIDLEGAKIWQDFKDQPQINTAAPLYGEYVERLGPVTGGGLGLIDQARVDALKNVGKIPDPGWQAKVRDTSRAETILAGTTNGITALSTPATGIMLEGQDINTAKALP